MRILKKPEEPRKNPGRTPERTPEEPWKNPGKTSGRTPEEPWKNPGKTLEEPLKSLRKIRVAENCEKVRHICSSAV